MRVWVGRALAAAALAAVASLAWAQAAPAPAAPAQMPSQTPAELPQAQPVPGGVALVPLGPAPQRPRAHWAGVPVLVAGSAQGWTAVVGIALAASPGAAALQVQAADAPARRAAFQISPVRYAEQRLQVPPGKVDLSPDDLARHERERSHQQQLLAQPPGDAPMALRMRAPVDGPRSSSFGLRRFFNGQARNPHNGMDIAAPVGTPVLSPLAARVLDVGDYFFNGKTVWLDHGGGLLSMLCHLSEIDVQPGEQLAAGQRLGAVGATGRVTGPHLHWSVSLNRTMVNPALFLAGAATP